MATNLTASLSSLLSSSTIDDHEERLKQANENLRRDKTNHDALHSRVVALIKLDRFEDALRALDDGGNKLGTRCALEKSYALYKTGQLEEAAKVVGEPNKDLRGLKHVAAQVAYRSERFEDAARMYKELSGQNATVEGEENDLRINSSATDVQLEWQGNGEKIEKARRKPGREDLEAFETAYNAACGYLARGDLGAGNLLLKRARDLCEALDDLSDDEKKAEVLPIMVQQIYVLIRMGKLEEAEVLQKMIHIADIPEAPNRVIAQNNALAAVMQHENPYITQRIFESVPGVANTEKLFKYQENIMQRNRYTISLLAMKQDGVVRSTEKILSQNSSPTTSPFLNSLSVFNATASAKGDNDKARLRLILPLLEKRPTDIGLILIIIQLYLLTNNAGPAVSLLESFFKRLEDSATSTDQDVLFAPGLVALLVSLYRLQGRKAPIQGLLRKAASYWRQKSKPSEGLLKAAALALLDSSKLEDLSAAGEIFVSLQEQDPNDRLAISGFVASNAAKNVSVVQSALDKLTPVERLISGIDTSALEEAGIASFPIAIPDAGRKRPAPLEKEKRAEKIRKSKMPKEFEEGKNMDPERWLPMKDRSTYRPKGKKGKKKALDVTQGGLVKDEESLELVGGAGAVKVEKAPLGVGKAKKKKGKK